MAQNEFRGKKIGQDSGINSSSDSFYKAPYFRKARPGYSSNFENTFNQERNSAAASEDTQVHMGYQGERARRSCLPCQQSHNTCREFEFINDSCFV